jgi:hypothetical protein
MPTPFRSAALLALAFAAVSRAQPTLERTSCLHPYEQDRAGVNLSLTAADWNDDGKADLALGTPYWDSEFGDSSNNGLFATYNRDPFEPGGWGQFSANYGSDGSHQGRALAAGDFDGDLVPEIAFSAPLNGGGKVYVFEPSETSCCVLVGIVLEQGTSNISGSSEEGDTFGHALAAGDFDGDGFADLAVGVIGESWPGVDGTEQGAVHVFYGTPDGLDGARDLLFGQHAFSGQTREDQDRFGHALAAGDLDGDGYDDLAIGAPYENEGTVINSGIVHVVFGSAAGLDFERTQNWTQSTAGITGSPEEGDQFGWSLAIGDFDRKTTSPVRRELAISAPFEDDGGIVNAGGIHVLYSGADGPTATGSQFLRRPGGSVANAAFGAELLAADLDHDTVDDLVVGSNGAPYATPPGYLADGEVHLFFGRLGGELRFSGLAPWIGTAGSCYDAGEANQQFGSAFAVGDFDDDGRIDLAIGIPGWSNTEGNIFEGAVEILFGSDALFRDGFDTGDTGRWSDAS